MILEKKVQKFNKNLEKLSKDLRIDILTDLQKSKVSSEMQNDDLNVSHEEWLAYLLYMEILSKKKNNF